MSYSNQPVFSKINPLDQPLETAFAMAACHGHGAPEMGNSRRRWASEASNSSRTCLGGLLPVRRKWFITAMTGDIQYHHILSCHIDFKFIPRCSMYGLFTYMTGWFTYRIHVWNIYLHWDYFKLHTGVNVGKYSIHGFSRNVVPPNVISWTLMKKNPRNSMSIYLPKTMVKLELCSPT